MTPSEFDLITREKVDRVTRSAGRLTMDELAELDAVGRKAIAAERR